MKITRIQADNLLGLRHIDVELLTPITLFAGRNGAGKSSIQEAVRMAITFEPTRGVRQKKEYRNLVLEGQSAGGAVVTIDDDAEKSFGFNLPKGDFSGPEIPEAMRVALYGQRFARMTPDERRTFLFGLMKIKASAATVKPRMLARGCDETKVDAVLPLLRTGFPSACEHAKAKATEAKGAWRQVTGATYGPLAAEAWEAPLPDAPAGDAAALAEQVAEYDRQLIVLAQNLGAIKSVAQQAKEAAAKRETLAAIASKLDSVEDQMRRAVEELADYEPKVEALRERAAGRARVGLVHDMARFIFTHMKPEILGHIIEDEGAELITRYEAEHGKLSGAAAVDVEAQATLPDHEKGLQVLKNRVNNLARDLAATRQAKTQYDALAPADDATDPAAEIAEVESMLAQMNKDRQQAENARLDIDAVLRQRAAAEQKTTTARARHRDVEAWAKVGDALAPDGIPNELLLDAIKPVNEALAQAAADSDWPQAVIAPDMALSAGGRAYHLLSESEQWRVDAMVAQVVAELSGIKVLMLDRVDVLDLPGRQQLLNWLDTLAALGVVDTALLFGTFKALPQGVADTITCYWVQDGTIAGAQQKAAA